MAEFGMEIRDAPPAHLLIEPRSFSESQKHQSREYFAGAYHWYYLLIHFIILLIAVFQFFSMKGSWISIIIGYI